MPLVAVETHGSNCLYQSLSLNEGVFPGEAHSRPPPDGITAEYCKDADVTNAGWTKIDEFGIDFSQTVSDDLRNALASKPEPYHPDGPGLWAAAKMIQDGSKWTVNIPAGLAPGGYVLRHELYALHNPKKDGDGTSGPQGYIACVQLDVTGDGTTTLPEGTQAGQLYDPNGDFANFDVCGSSFIVDSSAHSPPALPGWPDLQLQGAWPRGLGWCYRRWQLGRRQLELG